MLISRLQQAVSKGLFLISSFQQFFDKTIPDAESVLTEEDFQRVRRYKRQTMPDQQEEISIDDSAMYNKDRFEGDIGK
jgi:hypothetical protein